MGDGARWSRLKTAEEEEDDDIVIVCGSCYALSLLIDRQQVVLLLRLSMCGWLLALIELLLLGRIARNYPS